MKIAALVPFKALTQAKQRLREALPRDQVEALGRTMLEDVLAALRGSGLDAVYVLTEDPAVAEIAGTAGASAWIRTPDPGLNPTLDWAETRLLAEGFDASLVALGDLPLLASDQVNAVLAAGRVHPVVLAPAEDGGTALLWRRPPGCIPACFGPASAEAHARAAAERDLCACVLSQLDIGARSDLDTLDDARRLLASGRECRTAELLRKILE